MHLSNTSISEAGVLETLKEYLTIRTEALPFGGFMSRPAFTFLTKSGKEMSISIQASDLHYSTPRKSSHEFGFYSQVECGFPSWLLSKDTINEYAEDNEEPMDTVYPYIPLDIVAKEIYLAIQD